MTGLVQRDRSRHVRGRDRDRDRAGGCGQSAAVRAVGVGEFGGEREPARAGSWRGSGPCSRRAAPVRAVGADRQREARDRGVGLEGQRWESGEWTSRAASPYGATVGQRRRGEHHPLADRRVALAEDLERRLRGCAGGPRNGPQGDGPRRLVRDPAMHLHERAVRCRSQTALGHAARAAGCAGARPSSCAGWGCRGSARPGTAAPSGARGRARRTRRPCTGW